MAGLSTQRKVSSVVLRLGVFFCIIAGLVSRQASWLMQVLFQVTISKSAINRWVDEVADALPSEEEMVKLLHRQQPNEGPKKVKLIVTNLETKRASEILNAYARRWAVEVTF